MVLFSEMFVSRLIGIPVVDKLQEHVGEVRDIILSLGEVFPKVTGLLLRWPEGAVVLMSEIELVGQQFVVTKAVKERIVYTKLREGEVRLVKDLMDKQIVDTEGARVIRVNDLKLAKVGQDVRLIAADVGFKGLLRRLGWLEMISFVLGIFKKQVPDTLIGWDHVEQLKTDKAKGIITVPTKHLSEMHPSDIASVISQVHSEEKTAIFTSLSEKTAAEALHELEPKIQALLLMTIDTKRALSILDKMPVDEVADVLGDLPSENAENFLRLMKPKKAGEVRKLLKHPDETAGGLMTTEFIVLPHDLTTQQAIEKMRAEAVEAETIYYIYFTDDGGKLIGVISLRDLIVAPPDTKIDKVMSKNLITVEPETDQKTVAAIISKYNLLAVPVVDKAGKIMGIITVDDVIDFILPPISRRIRHMLG
ncbi:MAG: CBS domain-containing protein [Candidatus Margulisiibacteriota bacterium]|nr:CBS domain-containing protein [Candidatus Margulisiibacteriota bacterium]